MFRSYKQMTFSVIAFTALLFAIYSYVILVHKDLYMNDDYASWMDVKHKTTTRNVEQYNFVVMGDSRAKATFMPNEFDDDVFNSINLSLPASTPIEGYFTLKHYLEHNDAPDKLLVGYSSLLLSVPYFYLGNTVKFRYLDTDEYDEIAEMAEKLDDNDIIGAIDHREYIYFTGKYLTDLYAGITNARWKTNKLVADQLLTSKGHVYVSVFDEADGDSTEILLGEFKPSKIINHYFEKMIALANEHNIDFYWYTFPINNNSYNKLPDDFITAYQSYIDNLSQKYGFTVLSEFYGLEAQYFGDPDHLYRGAPLVTGMIKEEFVKERETQ